MAKHANIAYMDSGLMTMTEKDLILEFIQSDMKRQAEALAQQKAQQRSRK